VYQALEMLQQAWSNVSSSTIQNCFKHAGFHISDCPSEENDDDPDDDIPLAMLATMGLSQSLIRDFIFVDNQRQTTTDVSDESIIANVQSRRNNHVPDEDDDEDEEEEEEEESPEPTTSELIRAVNMLSRHFRQKENRSDLVKSLCVMSDNIVKDDFRKKCAKQTTITSFFKK
jgi:hypothetical protein